MNGIIYFRNCNKAEYESKCITICNGNIKFGIFLTDQLYMNNLTYTDSIVDIFYRHLTQQSLLCNILYVSALTLHTPNIYIITFDIEEKCIKSIEWKSSNNSHDEMLQFNQYRDRFLSRENYRLVENDYYRTYLECLIKN